MYEKFKKMQNGEKSGENDIKTSRKINRLQLLEKYEEMKKCHIVVKDICHIVVFVDFINLYHFHQV